MTDWLLSPELAAILVGCLAASAVIHLSQSNSHRSRVLTGKELDALLASDRQHSAEQRRHSTKRKKSGPQKRNIPERLETLTSGSSSSDVERESSVDDLLSLARLQKRVENVRKRTVVVQEHRLKKEKEQLPVEVEVVTGVESESVDLPSVEAETIEDKVDSEPSQIEINEAVIENPIEEITEKVELKAQVISAAPVDVVESEANNSDATKKKRNRKRGKKAVIESKIVDEKSDDKVEEPILDENVQTVPEPAPEPIAVSISEPVPIKNEQPSEESWSTATKRGVLNVDTLQQRLDALQEDLTLWQRTAQLHKNNNEQNLKKVTVLEQQTRIKQRQAQERIQQLETENQTLRENLRTLQSTAAELQAANDDMSAIQLEMSRLSKVMLETEHEMTRVCDERDALVQRTVDYETQLQEQRQRLQRMEVELNQSRSASAAVAEQVHQLERALQVSLTERDTQSNRLQTERESFELQLRQFESKCNVWNTEKESLLHANRTLSENNENLKFQFNDLSEKFTEKIKENETLVNEKKASSQENNDLLSEKQSLLDKIRELQLERDSLHSQVTKSVEQSEEQTRIILDLELNSKYLTNSLTEVQNELEVKSAEVVRLQGDENAIVVERDAVITERDAVIIERDAVVAERDAVIVERNAVIVERDTIAAERDSKIAESDALHSELNAKKSELAALQSSLPLQREVDTPVVVVAESESLLAKVEQEN